MAKEDMTPESINAKRIAEIEERHKEEMDALRNQIQLLHIIATKTSESPAESHLEAMKPIIQINADGKSYFCTTMQEKRIFMENNPGLKKFTCIGCDEKFNNPAKKMRCPKCSSERIYPTFETFKLSLPVNTADKYLNDTENKKQFTRKDK